MTGRGGEGRRKRGEREKLGGGGEGKKGGARGGQWRGDVWPASVAAAWSPAFPGRVFWRLLQSRSGVTPALLRRETLAKSHLSTSGLF